MNKVSRDDMKALFGRRLRRVREFFGETRETLAERLTATLETYRNWEEGKAGLPPQHVRSITRIYGISVDYFYVDEELSPEGFLTSRSQSDLARIAELEQEGRAKNEVIATQRIRIEQLNDEIEKAEAKLAAISKLLEKG